MKNWALVISLFIGVLLFCSSGVAARRSCSEVFSSVVLVRSVDLGFTQKFIGHKWAGHKISKIYGDFRELKAGDSKLTRSSYVLNKTFSDPLLAIRDVNGQIRLIDDHHKFYALSAFKGFRAKGFKLYFRLVDDYTQKNPRTGRKWTMSEMISDMTKKNHLVFLNTTGAKNKIFQEIPSRIQDMPDLPTRSLISFLLLSFEFPLKGSDFKPMIQFLFAKKMNQYDIEPFVGEPFSEKNILRLREEINKSKALIEFMMTNLKPDDGSQRYKAVSEYLTTLKEALLN